MASSSSSSATTTVTVSTTTPAADSTGYSSAVKRAYNIQKNDFTCAPSLPDGSNYHIILDVWNNVIGGIKLDSVLTVCVGNIAEQSDYIGAVTRAEQFTVDISTRSEGSSSFAPSLHYAFGTKYEACYVAKSIMIALKAHESAPHQLFPTASHTYCVAPPSSSSPPSCSPVCRTLSEASVCCAETTTPTFFSATSQRTPPPPPTKQKNKKRQQKPQQQQ